MWRVPKGLWKPRKRSHTLRTLVAIATNLIILRKILEGTRVLGREMFAGFKGTQTLVHLGEVLCEEGFVELV